MNGITSIVAAVVLLCGLLDCYIIRAVWKRCRRAKVLWRTLAVANAVFFLGGLMLEEILPGEMVTAHAPMFFWLVFALVSVYIPKFIWVLFDLLAKVPRLWGGHRIKWLAALGWSGVVVFAVMWWGALGGRYRIAVNEVEIASPEVPAAFDGFRIAQFSDFHLGTFGTDTAFVSKFVDRVNSLHPDLIVFTGDFVNSRALEMEPFVDVLARLEAPQGVYSVMGNHDFGTYYPWPTQAARIANLADMYACQAEAGFRLLNNNTDYISLGADSIALIGVENIGEPAMGSFGDLDQAYPGDLDDPVFKILLSHNPWHWQHDIADAPDKNIALTLSGHTHAMQMRFFGWSPAKWRYPTWGGLYQDSDGSHRIYVNIGAGEIGMPARLGSANPEITLFTLRRR